MPYSAVSELFPSKLEIQSTHLLRTIITPSRMIKILLFQMRDFTINIILGVVVNETDGLRRLVLRPSLIQLP